MVWQSSTNEDTAFPDHGDMTKGRLCHVPANPFSPKWHPAKPRTGTSILFAEFQFISELTAAFISNFGQVSCFGLHERYIPSQQFTKLFQTSVCVCVFVRVFVFLCSLLNFMWIVRRIIRATRFDFFNSLFSILCSSLFNIQLKGTRTAFGKALCFWAVLAWSPWMQSYLRTHFVPHVQHGN